MEHQLEQIDILGLYGVRDYSIPFLDSKLIIVGENGSGKTTVFKIIYHTLSCDWDSLRTFSFDEIILHFTDSMIIRIASDLLQSIFAIKEIDRIGYYIDGRYRGKRIFAEGLLNNIIQVKAQAQGKQEDELDRISVFNQYPYKYIQEIVNDPSVNSLYSITEQISAFFDAQILYLPTYRRIEEQLKNIFPYMDSDEWNKARKKTKSERAIELVEFGMADVEQAVKASQERLYEFSRAHQNKLTLGYLSEIISRSYQKVDVEEIISLSEEQTAAILYRIDSGILPDHQKHEIVKILAEIRQTHQPPVQVQEQIICHYFLKLIAFDKEISEEESSIIKFRDKCNKYLVNNCLIYDNQVFSCKIYNKVAGEISKTEEIQFQNLSSGEKQIVSLFSHLNLSQKNKVFVFIDEPELSLSVDWQRMFLVDILDSASCVGLFATTHSPFVFENELEKYVHGINEFCTRG